ncbi:MAG: hypothetical protein HYT80_05775, partial [Euryarchaeota archaeon]|nr:hypothetical protein [Euryarchaeota archaeon]
MRFESWIVLVAMVGTAFMPSHVLGDGPRLDCTPTLTVSTIGGLAPSEVAPPDGSTPNDEVEIAWEASHVGADCATALDAPPVLVAPWVTPDVGPASDFAMFVTYADPDNDPPVSVSLRMDDRAVQAMVPLDPADTEYRDGAVFVGGDAPDFSDGGNQMAAGPHVTRFYAHNGHAAAEPASIDAPFVVLTASGAVRAPNPTNRFVIHPIANGPTLVPPVEVLPPLAQLAGDPANGIYSYTFELGPLAGRGGLEYTVSSGGPSLLDGHLEGPLGDGFDVHGAAHASPDARTGDQAVELSAPGATSEDGVHGTLHAYPTPGYALVQIGGLSMWQRGDAVPGPAALRVGLLADLTREATADACLVTSFQPSSDGAWTRHEVGLADEFTVFEADCRTSGPLSRTATLSELHNDPAFGLAAFLRFEVALVEPGGAAWPADATVALDDLGLVASVSNTAADMDACIYRAEPGAPLSTFTPVECQSDIGPNGALIPAGSTHANVWAHQMVPVLGEDLLPRRTYLEPAGFAFSYKSVVPYDVAFPVVALPPPPTAGRVEFGEDVNGDGTLGLGEPLL